MERYDKYKIYSSDHEVVAVSTYAGRTVRGMAKCHPDDQMDYDKGVNLAKARCHMKIAAKRRKRSEKKMLEAYKQVTEAVAYYNRMVDYNKDSIEDFLAAENEVAALIAEY